MNIKPGTVLLLTSFVIVLVWIFSYMMSVRVASSQPPEGPMTVTQNLKVNDCVELVTVTDPANNERYLLATDKCGHTVALSKRF